MTCISDRFPRAALDAMVHAARSPSHDDGHTDCYYAGLLAAALPHLVTDEMVERALDGWDVAEPISRSFDRTDFDRQVMRSALLAALCHGDSPS
jgi:hypothetical protein